MYTITVSFTFIYLGMFEKKSINTLRTSTAFMLNGVFTAVFLLILFWSSTVYAQGSLPSSCVNRPFDATDFNLNGNASLLTTGTFELTENAGGQGGSSWYRRRLDMRVNFRISVDLFLGNNNGGADGIAFVLQNLDTGQGGTGGGLGYGGGTPITPSIAVEFDTWFNAGGDPPGGDDHIAFVLDGAAGTLPAPTNVNTVTNLENGNFHSVTFFWNPDTQIFRYRFTHSNGTVTENSLSINMIAHLGSNIAFWGFTGSTGGAQNQQMVRFDDNSICVVDATFPIVIGNNYDTTTGVVSLTSDDNQYFCSQFSAGFFNTAFHNGENPEPIAGDYILYNNRTPAPQRLVQGNAVAYMKMRDYNKIIAVRKSDGEIIAVYNCP